MTGIQQIAAIALAVLLAAGFWSGHPTSSQVFMKNETMTLTAHLGQSARDFFRDHPAIDPSSYIRVEGSGGYFEDWGMFDFLARANRAEDPGGYILRYKDGACDLSLPAGRAVAIDHNAGFFTLLTSTLPMTPLSFDEVMDLSNAIARKFEQAGWPRISHNTIEQDGFGAYSLGGKLEISGEWRPCDDPNLYASVIVKYFNSLPSGPHIPPVPGNVLPDDYPDRYLIQVDIGIDDKSLYDEVIALRDARRIAENGSKDAALSLKDWIDDPDWHPQGWRGRFIK